MTDLELIVTLNHLEAEARRLLAASPDSPAASFTVHVTARQDGTRKHRLSGGVGPSHDHTVFSGQTPESIHDQHGEKVLARLESLRRVAAAHGFTLTPIATPPEVREACAADDTA